LGYNNLARPPSSPSNKGGKIVPSAVLFRRRTSSNSDDDKNNLSIGKEISSLVGYAATQMVTDRVTDSREGGGGALVTSFKRVVGMKSSEANELKSNESDFWNSLPFDCIVTDVNDKVTDNQQHEIINRDKSLHDDFFDILGDSSVDDNDITNVDIEEEEGVAIIIQLSPQDEIIVTPLQVTTIILRAIQDAATEYLLTTINNIRSKKMQPPGLLLQQDDSTSQPIPNCVIGVPAHYSHAQRAAIRNAARKAGFSGHVSVMTESTAAAMAYGLFVSPTVSRVVSNNNGATTIATPSTNNSSSGEKNILVFDMGGGTTDVTIATINFGTPSVNDDNVRFHVVATACDSRLGGDDVDELLARYIWKLYALKASSVTASQNDELTWNVNERREIMSECRRAKEELCCSIDDKSSNDGMSSNSGTVKASIIFQGRTISISAQEFNSVIQPIVDRAEHVIQDALSTFKFRHDQMEMDTPIIHEVVLVGGSTHIPTVRTMLRRIFPPPNPSELCTSISAETAVAQGLAIQAALLSGLVPLWELRNAMMMDVLPHSIGVWISPIINMNHHNNDSDDAGGSKAVVPFTKGQIINPSTNQESHQGYYVPILEKDAPLPAKGNAAFTLATVKQPGVTVIAVEQIGPGDIFQCMGVFDFLLCRLEHNDDSKVRQVKIGMALEESGEFTVSIFDEKDPDHRDKRRRYLIEKALLRDGSSSIKHIQKDGEHLYDEDEERIDQRYSGTEISLAIICVISFVLYVATRIAFSNASSVEVCVNPG
jgi:molecular chaperone DnaK (HSP70)